MQRAVSFFVSLTPKNILDDEVLAAKSWYIAWMSLVVMTLKSSKEPGESLKIQLR